jgi:hypothetical protein
MSHQLFSNLSPKVDGRTREDWQALIQPAQQLLTAEIDKCRDRQAVERLAHRLMSEGPRFERAFWATLIGMELAARAKP